MVDARRQAARLARTEPLRAGAVAVLLVAGCGGFHTIGGDDAGAPDGGRADMTASPFKVVLGVPEGGVLTSVWGYDKDHAFAVGSGGVKYVYAMGNWNRLNVTEPGVDFYQVWGVPDGSEVYCVGLDTNTNHGVLQRWNGAGWTDEYLPSSGLFGLWGDDKVILAVGAKGLMHGKQRGTTAWAVRQTFPPNMDVTNNPPDAPVLWSIAGDDIFDFAIAADVDMIFHGTGTNIEYLEPMPDTSVVFRTVWATPGQKTNFFFGANDLAVYWLNPGQPSDLGMVAGDLFQLYRDDAPMGADQKFIRGIWGADASEVIFVGDAARIYLWRAPDVLSTLPAPTVDALYGVWGSSTDDVWIVGERETILHGKLP